MFRRPHEIAQREIVVCDGPHYGTTVCPNCHVIVVHVYEPKPHKYKEAMTTRDDSKSPYSAYKQWEHAR